MLPSITRNKTEHAFEQINPFRKKWPVIIGLCVVLAGWSLLYIFTNKLVVASPWDTLIYFGKSFLLPSFWQPVLVTLKRFVWGLLVGGSAGIILGVLAGLNRQVKEILEPLRWVLLTIPPVVLIMITMIILGLTDLQNTVVLIIMIAPIMYINTVAGIEAIDKNLVEMAGVYKLDFPGTIKKIYLPGIFSYINAGLVLCVGLGIRIIVLAEVLGAQDGIGYKIAMAKLKLEVTELYSWILACLFIVGFFEFVILYPVKRYLNRWK